MAEKYAWASRPVYRPRMDWTGHRRKTGHTSTLRGLIVLLTVPIALALVLLTGIQAFWALPLIALAVELAT